MPARVPGLQHAPCAGRYVNLPQNDYKVAKLYNMAHVLLEIAVL